MSFLLGALIVAGIFIIVFAVAWWKSPERTYFCYAIVPSSVNNGLLFALEGNKNMRYGDYHIFFELADGSEMSIIDIDGFIHSKWITQSFVKGNRRHAYYLNDVPLGKNILILRIIDDYLERKVYIPFDHQLEIPSSAERA